MRWVIDPLDGTTNYFNGSDHFSISIALQEKQDDGSYRTLLGVVHHPSHKQTFWAIAGLKAWCNDTPLRITTHRPLEECIARTNFPYDRSNSAINNIAQIEQVVKAVSNLRIYGCASLDAVSVACETASIYWERYVNWWDIAAALLIVEEAGGSTLCEISPLGRGLQVGAASSKTLLEGLREILRA